MGLSYQIFAISELETNKDFKEHVQSLTIHGKLSLDKVEQDSRYPTLREIYKSISEAEISIVDEQKTNDEFKKGIVIHSLSIKDDQNDFDSDFTMRYPEDKNETDEIKTIFGIKSDLRLLTKLVSILAKRCGSFVIISPYDLYYIDKSKSYIENWTKYN
jgi:hypothetical protein